MTVTLLFFFLDSDTILRYSSLDPETAAPAKGRVRVPSSPKDGSACRV